MSFCLLAFGSHFNLKFKSIVLTAAGQRHQKTSIQRKTNLNLRIFLSNQFSFDDKKTRMHLRFLKVFPVVSCLILTSTLFLPPAAHAIGLRIAFQDAEAAARGNAFVATADNPSAMYYNPAGITQLEGQHLQVGLYNTWVTSYYTAPNGSKASTLFEVQPVPQIYYTRAITNTDFTLGLGIFAPFGLGLQWPADTSFNTLAIEGRLLYSTVHPAIAWKIHPTLSLSAGPTINYAQVMLKNAIGFTPGDRFLFKGRDFDFGYNLGLRWQPVQEVAVGVTYKSATSMNFHGQSEASPYTPQESTHARLPFPQIVTGGVSYRPNKDWNFEFDIDWTQWSRMTTVTFGKSSGPIPFAFNWNDSFLYEFGVTRYLNNGYWVAAGYFYSENTTSTASFSPLLPDTNLHVGSIGFGHKGEVWSWAISYNLITGPPRTVTGSTPSPTGQSADGKYQFLNHALNLSVDYKF